MSRLRIPWAIDAEQVRLHAQQVPVAAGVMEDGLDPRLPGQEEGQGHRAHPGAGAGAVGDVDADDALVGEHPGRLQRLGGVGAARRDDLDADDEFPVLEPPPELGAVPDGRRFDPRPLALGRRRTETTGRRGGRRARTAPLMALMWAGVVPQHPPMSFTPARMNLLAYSAM